MIAIKLRDILGLEAEPVEESQPQHQRLLRVETRSADSLKFAQKLAWHAGQQAMQTFRRGGAWTKHDHSAVTFTDLRVEHMIVEEIDKRYPLHVVLAEECADKPLFSGEEEGVWVIDPIDGTGAFASGLTGWGVSIAFFEHGSAAAGVFYAPACHELYLATRYGEPRVIYDCGEATHRTQKLRPLATTLLTPQSVLLAPSTLHHHFQSHFVGKQRSLGSHALHICMVARGVAVGALMRPCIWDVAAATLILRRTGGDLFDIESGQPLNLPSYFNILRLPWCLAAPTKETFYEIRSQLEKVVEV